MASLKDWDIIRLSTLITNVDAKLSATTRADGDFQILCLVRRNDQILFRYQDTRASGIGGGGGEVHLMLICWFAENRKCVQDICFDSTGSWLLVFCYDNTLHIVPALSICDKSRKLDATFNQDEITSFIVPFIGPHECPNPQTCPNNSHNLSSVASHRSSIASEASTKSSLSSDLASPAAASAAAQQLQTMKRSDSSYTTHKIDEVFSLNSIYSKLYGADQQQQQAPPDAATPIAMKTIENFFAESGVSAKDAKEDGTKSSSPQECYSRTLSSSIESTVSVSCPYPTCCSWWKTLADEPRAILGYSDGSICVVALTPNCPFLGNTNCERGSIEKLVICQDNSMETISLMINTSTKEQWKLLLEQKSIKYTFPGDISPTSSQELKAEMMKSFGDSGERTDSGTMDDWQIVVSLPKDGPNGNSFEQQDSGEKGSGSSPSGSEPQSSDDFEKIEGEGSIDDKDQQGSLPKLFPAARARLMSLRDLGAKKIGTLKLKLSESRIKAKEKERIKEQAANLAVMELPGMYPEILTTPAGPYFVVQYIEGKYLLSALHSYSDTLSVHSMDISLIPLHIYKVPKQCKSTVLTKNVIYVMHHLSLASGKSTESTNSSPDAHDETMDGEIATRRDTESSIENLESSQSQTHGDEEDLSTTETTNTDTVNAVSVVSCQMASMKMGDDCDFNEHAMLALFQFPDEKILDIHQISSLGEAAECKATEPRSDPQEEPGDVRSVFQRTTVSNYLRMQRTLRMDKKLETNEAQVMVGEFPKVEFDKALVVTDKNLYSIELNDTARNLFLKLAHKSIWAACEDFCTTFGLPLATCVEYAGDMLLKRRKITEALMTYNVARLSPMKTALKLAMVNENGALMKLCSMALRNSHIINSQFVMHDVMRILVDEAHLGNVVYDSLMNLNAKVSLKPINVGAQCSDYSYDNDDVSWDVQISTTAQFHLSNLMMLTLCERCVQDKNYIPLWNFIVTNSKYHTSLACIVLAHGKLYSSAVLLAMIRGTCLDVFSCLIGIWEQLADSNAEMNAYVYNLSNELFMESLIYLQEYTMEYFEMIRKCIDKFDINVLERLIRQLNPFHSIYRPLLHKLSNHDSSSRELDKNLLIFCKSLIETFLAVSIRAQMLKLHSGNFLNAMKLVRVHYDERLVEIRLKQFSPISAGFSHAGCVMNKVAYLWGSNGVNCALSRTSLQGDPLGPNGYPPTAAFLKQLDLEVLAVQCGRLHTLLLTSNGIYSMGANNLGQLGIGNHVLNALQPMLVQTLDGKNISHICAGQYHNAVVANGLLYTWGWGIFGQLGHGSVADCSRPKVVEFFRKKNVQQISLGHAHTLVLCKPDVNARNVLYVFGSNHYGQLGLGQEDKFNVTIDTRNGKSFVLSLVPRRLEFGEEVSLITTKLFVNMVLTASNKLYTWGASPQALRLATQARKRAKSSHKCRSANVPMVETKVNEQPPAAPPPPPPTVATTPEADPAAEGTSSTEEQPTSSDSGVDNADSGPVDPPVAVGPIPDIKIEDTSEDSKPAESAESDGKQQPAAASDEIAEHLFPTLVDTTLVQDDIVKISTGLYHFALVTSKAHIFTWGKNIERQLGREGGRNEVLIPTKLDTIADVEYVECGADFTLVMTDDGTVKSWGNNNMGQCAKDINPERSGVPGKLVRLPISNRLVRIPDSSQFIELPHEIKLPQSDGSHEAGGQVLRLIKSMPKFRRNFVVRSTLEKLISANISTISSSLNDVSNTTEMEDFVGELRTAFDCRIQHQNASTMSSLQSVSYATSPTSLAADDDDDEEGLEEMDPEEASSEASSRLFNERHLLSNDFIHFCLYIFHGLYNQDNILDLTKRCNEYHIRMMMLNYDYVEAFHLILELLSGSLSSSASQVTIAKTTMNLVKIFEYFTKDSNIIPMDTANFKYFIYELFMFFIKHNIALDVLEEYFLRNLDYYLVQLAFVLYFSNTNNLAAGFRSNAVDAETLELERKLLDKFNNNGHNLLAAAETFGSSTGSSPQSTSSSRVVRKLENTEAISRALSTKFSVVLCQKLIEHFEHYK